MIHKKITSQVQVKLLMSQNTANQVKQRFKKVSIRTLMTFPFILQVTVAVWIIGYFSFQNAQKNANDFSNKLRATAIASLKNEISDYLETPIQIIKLSAETQREKPLDTQKPIEIIQQFRTLTNVFPSVREIFLGDISGNFIGVIRQPDDTLAVKITEDFPKRNWYVLNDQGKFGALFKTEAAYDPRSRPWYQQAIANKKLIWSDIYPFADSIDIGISATQFIFDQQGNPKYAIAASLNLGRISEFLEKTRVTPNSQTFIVERSGLLVATSNIAPPFTITQEGKVQRLKASDSSNPFIRETMIGVNKRFGEIANIQDTDKLELSISRDLRGYKEGEKQLVEIFIYRGAAGLEWYVFTVIPESDILAQANHDTASLIWICIGVVIILIILGMITTRWIVKPIFQLREASIAIAGENYD